MRAADDLIRQLGGPKSELLCRVIEAMMAVEAGVVAEEDVLREIAVNLTLNDDDDSDEDDGDELQQIGEDYEDLEDELGRCLDGVDPADPDEDEGNESPPAEREKVKI